MIHRSFLAALALAIVTMGAQVAAQTPSGAYLAAQHARAQGDFAAAAQYYAQALARDPGNAAMLENAAFAYMALGQVDRAVAVARKMEAEGAQPGSRISRSFRRSEAREGTGPRSSSASRRARGGRSGRWA